MIAPVTRRSGTSIRGEHVARGGNKRLKRALFLSAFASLSHPPSRAYYDRKRAQGKRHNQALIALGAPIEGEAGLGYVLAPGDGPPMPALTWRQAETLWRGARILSLVAKEEGAQTAARSLAALSAVLGDDRVQRLAAEPVLPEAGELKPVPAVLGALERAIEAGLADAQAERFSSRTAIDIAHDVIRASGHAS